MPSHHLEPVTHRGLASEVANRLRSAIFQGAIAPSQELLEVELATSLEVSRGPVREALALLTREGLVGTAWHRPARVISVTRHDAVELYELRAALDRLAVVSAAKTRDHSSIEAALADLVGAAGKTDDPARLLELDLCFHDSVFSCAANSRLDDAWLAIRSQVQLFQTHRVNIDAAEYRRRVVVEHTELARLISRGPSEALEQYAVAHIEDALQVLLPSLKR
jgi:DNA-binding GntR family transcriptional regulator